MNREEISELIRAHLDAGVDIDIPDAEIARACKPSFDLLHERIDALEKRLNDSAKPARMPRKLRVGRAVSTLPPAAPVAVAAPAAPRRLDILATSKPAARRMECAA